MSHPEFDKFAAEYRELHRENIAASGERPEYFAAYKMRDFATVVNTLGGDKSGTFLDYGSGIGASIAPFHEAIPGARLICADVSEESLKLSRALNGDRPTYLSLRDDRINLDDASLDGAFACCVFHHIPADQHIKVLRELRRVLKPGAPLMIYEHNPYNPLTVRAVNTCPLDENAVLIVGREMRARCAEAGFAHIEVDYRVFFPSALKALRFAENWLRWLPIGAQYCLHGRA